MQTVIMNKQRTAEIGKREKEMDNDRLKRKKFNQVERLLNFKWKRI
jgi:hypothetical protein